MLRYAPEFGIQARRQLLGLSEMAARCLVWNVPVLLFAFVAFLLVALELRGSLLAAQSKTDDAKALFASAAKEEKALGYREPPNYIRPVGETEGAAMLAARRWADAKAAFERALVERPHSGFAVYGIARVLEQSGDHEATVKAYTDFLTAWKEADSTLPQMAHARKYVTANRE